MCYIIFWSYLSFIDINFYIVLSNFLIERLIFLIESRTYILSAILCLLFLFWSTFKLLIEYIYIAFILDFKSINFGWFVSILVIFFLHLIFYFRIGRIFFNKNWWNVLKIRWIFGKLFMVKIWRNLIIILLKFGRNFSFLFIFFWNSRQILQFRLYNFKVLFGK